MFDAMKLAAEVGENKATDILAQNIADWIDEQILTEIIMEETQMPNAQENLMAITMHNIQEALAKPKEEVPHIVYLDDEDTKPHKDCPDTCTPTECMFRGFPGACPLVKAEKRGAS
jgi:hypothetical protein